MVWDRKHSSPDKPRWNQDDYHKDFVGKIKAQIEQGVAPWQKPWKPGEQRLPKNIQTDKSYRCGNSVYLSVTQTAKGYSDHRWATYKQIKDMGGQVRKGEKATHVLFYKFDDEKAQQQPGALLHGATRQGWSKGSDDAVMYCPRVLGQWFDGIRFYAAVSSPRRSRRTWAGLR